MQFGATTQLLTDRVQPGSDLKNVPTGFFGEVVAHPNLQTMSRVASLGRLQRGADPRHADRPYEQQLKAEREAQERRLKELIAALG